MSAATQTKSPFREYPRWQETLRDRSSVLIRPISRLDRDAERAFIENLPLNAPRFKIFGQLGHPSEEAIEELTDIDYVHEMAFIAIVKEDAHERIVGVSRYRTDHLVLTCECSVTVDIAWQDKGLGTRLMQHLIEMAQSMGIQRMFAFVSIENLQMRELVSFLGFQKKIDEEHPEPVVYELDMAAAN
jgi:ribosomal protein S18 acetylase RimI-like enzyme